MRPSNIFQETLDEDTKIYLGKSVQEIVAYVLACETIEPKSRASIGESTDRSVIQFLEILTSQQIHKR
jgi:hypothetical protein